MNVIAFIALTSSKTCSRSSIVIPYGTWDLFRISAEHFDDLLIIAVMTESIVVLGSDCSTTKVLTSFQGSN